VGAVTCVLRETTRRSQEGGENPKEALFRCRRTATSLLQEEKEERFLGWDPFLKRHCSRWTEGGGVISCGSTVVRAVKQAEGKEY